MKKSQIIILGSLCGAEAIGLVRAINGDANGIGSCMIVTALMAVYIIYLAYQTVGKKNCPKCKSSVPSKDRICSECGHLFQNGISEEKLTEYIEKEKADEMSSEQIDDAFEKVESVSYDQSSAYDEDLEDYLKKQ